MPRSRKARRLGADFCAGSPPDAGDRLEAVRQDGMALRYLPSNFRTKIFCEAVRQNGLALESLRTREASLKAAEQPDWVAANDFETLKHILSHQCLSSCPPGL
ncbi:DUF4116 domain-containing protein [Roseibium sp. RKSG952]|uniref:DUF4116 domain-containing protein n=1 Tax=Roseibium sp. RKSG952 TaxID=2529384 RepID=UPI0034D001AA